jgi:hypothetical protein
MCGMLISVTLAAASPTNLPSFQLRFQSGSRGHV